ncbi:MAG: 23S rRNA (guanosine(2251)-2'-O)-methyltransferase RlmB [Planctomycetota bacterium]|nr:MAG: 23S rRNA (guanosine(2251)-2'-O)-methyltransferase RlmB [Planctomycetota bacterium]
MAYSGDKNTYKGKSNNKGSRSKNPSRQHQHTDFQKSVEYYSESELESIIQSKENPFVLILDCVQDPHNLGACLRTANGAGVDAVIVPKDKSVLLTETVRRIACGAAEAIPLVPVTNLVRTMQMLQASGLWLVGTSDKGDKTLYDLDLKGGLGIVMGAEGKGLRRLTSESCDFLVKLPMLGQVDCLNVSVATGVCLYEAVRQRLVSNN